MNYKVEFQETTKQFSVGFGEVREISDGGYEQGYEAGYEEGLKVNADCVKSVNNTFPDENGNVEIEVGGAVVSNSAWRLIRAIEITEDTYQINVTQDEDGNDFKLDEILIDVLNNQTPLTAAGDIPIRVETNRRTIGAAFVNSLTPVAASKRTVVLDTPTMQQKYVGSGAGNGWTSGGNIWANIQGIANSTKIETIKLRAPASSTVAFGVGFKCEIWGR